MTRRKLEKRLRDLGFEQIRRGGRHDVWGNGQRTIPVPRHREIGDALAKSILREAAASQAKRLGMPSD